MHILRWLHRFFILLFSFPCLYRQVLWLLIHTVVCFQIKGEMLYHANYGMFVMNLNVLVIVVYNSTVLIHTVTNVSCISIYQILTRFILTWPVGVFVSNHCVVRLISILISEISIMTSNFRAFRKISIVTRFRFKKNQQS